jgi:phenylpropionate dioxygenase-like ring-hydroxylating dioxygenase large terminal subunit
MLSREDNELLVRVGPGTAMGNLIRRFWIPALLKSELPENDGAPVRIKLLGEPLVAFRDSKGRIGLLDEHCPHRRTSLALGVNEECGLRCLYHGWKFDVNGQCVDTPAEPEGATLAKNMRTTAYPTHVAGGVIWAYMGPAELRPPFPDLPWTRMPEGHAVPFKILEDCNYAQAVEGTVDSAHAGILHRESPWGHEAKYPHEKDLRPKLEVEHTAYGLRYCAIRTLSEAGRHARVTQVVLPFWTFIPPDGAGSEIRKNRRLANAFVPRDDESTWHIQWFYDDTRKIDVEDRIEEGGHWHDDEFRKDLNIDNWYRQDRDMMRTTNLSGIRGIMTQDHAVSETQGRILDRTKEHLGRSDVAVVGWRRLMLRAARDLAEKGVAPVTASQAIDWDRVTAETFLFSADQNWKDILPLPRELRLERTAPAQPA